MKFLLQQIVTDHKHWSDFCFSELDAILTQHNLIPSECYNRHDTLNNHSPYLSIELPSIEIGCAIVNRAVLIRNIYYCYTHASTLQQCLDSITSTCHTILSTTQTWAIDIVPYGYRMNGMESDSIRRKFSGKLKFNGKVNKTTPELQLSVHIVCDLTHLTNIKPLLDDRIIHIYLCQSIIQPNDSILINNTPNIKQMIHEMSLSARPYIGPTSTSTELSMLMCNYAGIQSGDHIYDPFVGTGSILLSASSLGAHVMGTDIDWKSLHGQLRGNDHINKNIYKNFEFYNLNKPELICCDCSHNNISSKYTDQLFDAIITDPPYGIRAGAKKTGHNSTTHTQLNSIDSQFASVHIPQLQPYDIEDVMNDLLDTAARTLKVGGKLVYLLPATCYFNPDTDIPIHSCMSVLYVAQQLLRTNFIRYCITLVKHSKYNGIKMRRRDRINEPIPAYAAVKNDLVELNSAYKQQKLQRMRIPDELEQPMSRKKYVQYKKQIKANKQQQQSSINAPDSNNHKSQHSNNHTVLSYYYNRLTSHLSTHTVLVSTVAATLTVLSIALYSMKHRPK